MKTIGFFGDSFCSDLRSNKLETFTQKFKALPPSFFGDNQVDYLRSDKFETYIEKIIGKNNLKLTSLGTNGSSIYDVILIQFLPFFNTDKLPDVIIFVWTDETRLFHRRIRNINISTVDHNKEKNEIWNAATKYYEHLIDLEFNQFQYVSALKYFDQEILSKLPWDKKIIHLKSFENKWLEKYNFNWKHGIEITSHLELLVDPITNTAANHIYGNEKNQILFERIQNVLENWDTIQLAKHSGIV